MVNSTSKRAIFILNFIKSASKLIKKCEIPISKFFRVCGELRVESLELLFFLFENPNKSIKDIKWLISHMAIARKAVLLNHFLQKIIINLIILCFYAESFAEYKNYLLMYVRDFIVESKEEENINN